jgi:hypothetical protein
MIVEETIEKLLQLHLKVMAQSLRELIAEPGSAAMSFEDKLALIVDREWTGRIGSSPPVSSKRNWA